MVTVASSHTDNTNYARTGNATADTRPNNAAGLFSKVFVGSATVAISSTRHRPCPQ